jgi:hypothetical protein
MPLATRKRRERSAEEETRKLPTLSPVLDEQDTHQLVLKHDKNIYKVWFPCSR